MYYSILENLSQRVYKHQRIRDIQHPKDLLEEKREELLQYEIDACVIVDYHDMFKSFVVMLSYSMCSLVVSVLDSPAVDPRSNPDSGSALLMSE